MHIRTYSSFIIVVTFSFFLTNAQSHYPGQHQEKFKVGDIQKSPVYAFDLNDIKLLESPFKENMERNGRWLLSIDVSRLLHGFRVNAGLPTHAVAYGGWE